MLNCLIFSKDRPLQLEVLLRSIQDNFKELDNIQILYKYTTNDFKVGYDLVKAIHKDSKFNFIEEFAFVDQTKQIITLFNQPYSIILVDDEVVINDYDISSHLYNLDNDTNQCISLRLHPDISHTYTTNVPCAPILLKPHLAALYSWQWRNYNPLNEFGYPSCINSHLYKSEFLKMIVNNIPFRSVNNLEEVMHSQRAYFKPYMMCFDKAKTISIANNKVQTEIPTNTCSNKIEYTAENLNKKFLDGYKICTKNIYGIKSNQATTELEYRWEKI